MRSGGAREGAAGAARARAEARPLAGCARALPAAHHLMPPSPLRQRASSAGAHLARGGGDHRAAAHGWRRGAPPPTPASAARRLLRCGVVSRWEGANKRGHTDTLGPSHERY